ncbi:MAG: S8 family serine peptidase [Anaerolineae bacterium]|nr:S8 family serine peptidase [Anaerolineae bacterium]
MLRQVRNSTVLLILLLALLFGSAFSLSAQEPGVAAKIDPHLMQALVTEGASDLIVRFAAQADLSPAYSMDWEARGRFVYQALQRTADQAQARARALLDADGLAHATFVAGNELYVWAGDLEAARALAALPEVDTIRAPRTFAIAPVVQGPTLPAPDTLAWGIVDAGADQFWAQFGFKGEGTVVANIDTGVEWTHDALVGTYRCADDPGNPICWEDPSDICGGEPCDNNGHGTHTMGTITASDDPSLTWQAGMAPNSLWIACKGCESSFCSEFALNACADWVLAPGGDPLYRPHVVNNSWGGAGCDTWYQAKVQAWQAAGIFPTFSAGGGGSGCATLGSPGDYQESFDVVAHDSNRWIGSFSSRGPSCFGHDPYTKPNISAPGVQICSTVPGNGWNCGYSGTSMSAPHAAGAAALLWSCNPGLVGQVYATFEALQNTADAPPEGNCGAPPDGEGNYTYGYGYLNVLAAGQVYCGIAQFGYLDGYVYDLDDDLAVPCTDAVVRVEPGSLDVPVDANGYYWAQLITGTYEVTATAPGYSVDGPYVIEIVDNMTTTQDFFFTRPFIAVTPGEFISVEVPVGDPVTYTMTISNWGGLPLDFEIVELTGTLQPLVIGPTAYGIDPFIDQELAASADGRADVFIAFGGSVDLTPATAMDDPARGQWVYDTLLARADATQARVRGWLQARSIDYRVMLVNNSIFARLSAGEMDELLALPEVVGFRGNHVYHVDPIVADTVEPDSGVNALAWGIEQVGANLVWQDFGVRGQGTIVANIDTGVEWDHDALIGTYGCPGDPGNNACWEDPSNICGGTPCDNNGHGTHTMGTMTAFDDPGFTWQAGMAPDSTWIACKGCESSSCSEYALTACGDWALAPGGDPANRPHVINNSWGGGSCNTWYLPYVLAWRASGIFPAFAPGGGGPGCGTVGSPGDYPESFATGATDQNDVVGSFSSRGPSCWDGIKPDVTAPGINICSTVPGNGWSCGYSGTSTSSPHSAGLAALVMSANPALARDVPAVEQIVKDTALCIEDLQCGGEPCPGCNNVYGCGRIDAYAAVEAALGPTGLPWTWQVPVSGTIDPYDHWNVDVAFWCSATGELSGTLEIRHNDPCQEPLHLPLLVHCAGPDEVDWEWLKWVWIDGAGPYDPSMSPFVVEPGAVVEIADQVWVSSTSLITFTLSEMWGDSLELIGYEVTAGTVTTGATWLDWYGVDLSSGWYALTKTFGVADVPWWYTDVVSEYLWIEDTFPQPDPVYLEFEHPCEEITDIAIAGPTSGFTGTVYTFDTNYLPPTATLPVDYLWDDGGTADYSTRTWALPGIYTLTVEAFNCAAGWASSFHVIEIAPLSDCTPVSGTAFVYEPAMPYAGDPVTFTASVVEGDAPTFSWDFGDGLGGVGITVTHVFTPAGAYTVTLTAENACGTERVSDVIAVSKYGAVRTVYLPLIRRE